MMWTCNGRYMRIYIIKVRNINDTMYKNKFRRDIQIRNLIIFTTMSLLRKNLFKEFDIKNNEI